MALAVDSQMAGQNSQYATGQSSPFSFLFNNAAGNVLYLAVTVGVDLSTVSATYDTAPMLLLGTRAADVNARGQVALFRLASPSTGNKNVVITFSGGSSVVTAALISFSGVRPGESGCAAALSE